MSKNRSKPVQYYAGIAGLVSPIIWIVVVIILGFFYPGYNHLENFISTLSAIDAPYNLMIIQRLNFFQFGIMVLLVGIALNREIDNPSKAGFILLMIEGASIFLSGIFSSSITDPDAFTNIMHNLVGIPIFLTAFFVPFIFGRKLQHEEGWTHVKTPSYLMSVVMFLSLFIMVFSDLPGLGQRIFLGFYFLWLALVSYQLYKTRTQE